MAIPTFHGRAGVHELITGLRSKDTEVLPVEGVAIPSRRRRGKCREMNPPPSQQAENTPVAPPAAPPEPATVQTRSRRG